MRLEGRLAAALERLGLSDADRFGVACSGGADSIALLHLCRAVGRQVVALHVDHGIRAGSEADADFVAARAADLGVACVSERVDVDVGREGVEAAARSARYDALRRLAARADVAAVATAHTLDDQAETVLLRAFRGATLDAIAPVRGRFVRPLLDVRRDELRDWLTREQITWREDPSNADVAFDRNWVRHEILPRLRERRTGVDRALARIASRTRDDAAALDALATEMFDRARCDDVGVLLDAADIDLAPPAVAGRVVRMALRRTGTDPSADDIERIRAMPPGHLRGGHLRGGHLTVCSTDVWRLDRAVAFTRRPAMVPGTVELPARGTVEDPHRRLRIRVGTADAPAWRWRASVPPRGSLFVRARDPGDRVGVPAGSRKVSDVLIDAKVPRPVRDLAGILATPERAIAVVGISRGAAAAASGRVVDVEPFGDPHLGWARELLWTT